MKICSMAIIMIFLTLSLYGQNTSADKIMYVTSENGLRQRENPSTNGRVMGSFLFGERIRVLERTNTLETIDGITDYWYKTWSNESNSHGQLYCWIFGGYISEEFPPNAQILLGVWFMVNERDEYIGLAYRFNTDYTFRIGPLEKGEVSIGTWERKNNTIVLKFIGDGNPENWSNDVEVKTVRLQMIDRNNIILHFENDNIPYFRNTGSVKLIRSNDTWV